MAGGTDSAGTNEQTIGKYRIDGTLGTGAMGVVYRAYDPQIRRPVALKTIHSDLLGEDSREAMLERFQNEAVAAGRLIHQNIVTVFDFGTHDDVAFIAMELVEGKTLKSLTAKKKIPDIHYTLNWIQQLLRALDYAHGCGIVHRDIKPANLMVTPGNRVKVTDFGVAKIDATMTTQFGSVVGTPSYMAPEQMFGGPVDGRADIYATAVILYELLTGTRPYKGQAPSADADATRVIAPPLPSKVNPTVPRAFDAVVMRALERNVDDRFDTATDFRHALQAAYEEADETLASGASVSVPVVMTPAEPPPAEPARAAAVSPPPAARESSRPGAPAGTAPGGQTAPAQTAGGDHSHPHEGHSSFSHWTAEFLTEIDAILIIHLGPITKTLVRRVGKKAATHEAFHAMLAAEISDQKLRARFSESFRALTRRLGHHTGGTSPGVAATAPGHAATGGEASRLDLTSENLADVQRILTTHIGPLARVLVKKVAGKARDNEDFFQQLAAYIDDPGHRARFLEQVAGGIG